jgi:lipoyl synthase
MVLGDLCTRGCRFCAVSKMAKGIEVDKQEPEKLARVVKEWGLDYIVITSVCRDDLPDQGAEHFARCITEIKKENPDTIIEVLIPDFKGDIECLRKIVAAKPHVIGHNVETVERLTTSVRDRRATYIQSLGVLAKVKQIDNTVYTKSAMMLGIGETEEEILKTFNDLRHNNVDFIAIGQYLRPSQHHIEVKEYVTPEKFEYFNRKATDMGFLYVAAGPFVRSSYRAGEYFIKAIVNK